MKKDLEKNEELFKSVYKFTFIFTQEPGKKNIDVEYAKLLWPLLMGSKCNFMADWIAFIEKSEIKSVKKDQWDMFYELCKSTKG